MGIRTNHCLCIIHPIDPRGSKIGGIETHIRLLLRHAPRGWRLLVIGVDGYGDCKLGEVNNIAVNGRHIEFFPVVHFPDNAIHEAATRLHRSLTVRFAAGLMKSLLRIRNVIGAESASVELERFEFAVVPRLLSLPTVQVIHGEGSRQDQMDSLIKKYWFIHRATEEMAIRMANAIVCVNPNIEARIKRKLPKRAQSIEFMPVPIDTAVFNPRPFHSSNGIFRIVFAGRLDSFKDPPMMFRVLRELHERLGGTVEFHYIGTSDPCRYVEFQPIDGFTRCHGFKSPTEVATIVEHCHAGLLTSFFEGMPCYLLEVLSVGRPVVAIRLPQYDLLIREGVSGSLVERQPNDLDTIDLMVKRLVATWSGIQRDEFSPDELHAIVDPFSTTSLLGRHFARHERIARPGPADAGPFASSASFE